MKMPRTNHLKRTMQPGCCKATAVCLAVRSHNLVEQSTDTVLQGSTCNDHAVYSSDSVFTVAWTGDHIASGGQDDSVRLWQVSTHRNSASCWYLARDAGRC